MALRKVSKELQLLQTSPPEGIRIQVDEANLSTLTGWIGGYFKIRINLADSDFPNTPPKCTMATKIFHPNVAPSTGEICVSTLKKDWKREYGIGHILITVKCLLIHPNPESALHEEAGKLLLEAYHDYAKHARLMTDVHARHRPAEFSTISSSASTSKTSTSTSSISASSSKQLANAPAYPATISNNENLDIAMQEAPEMIKSGPPSFSAQSAGSTIPKKRPSPTSMGSTPLSSFGNAVPPQPNSSVLGATASVHTANATKKAPAATGAAAQKKRALKRL